MAINYFANFPKITYKDKKTRNILLRAALRDTVKESTSVYLPLTLEDGERTDMIAQDLYNNAGYDWLVKFSNDVVDPYFDWLLDDYKFSEFIDKKYGSLENALSQILYYKRLDGSDITITVDTYNLMTVGEKGDYGMVTAYDYEVEKNEANRIADIISPEYANIISNELEKKLNE